jgi:hypothetical protein
MQSSSSLQAVFKGTNSPMVDMGVSVCLVWPVTPVAGVEQPLLIDQFLPEWWGRGEKD